jgi:RimJ/RimL family protein N-acetyltransferase
MLAGLDAVAGPTDDEWWMATVADGRTGEPIGDLAVRLSWDGRAAEIGYTFHPRFWGRGYATEAVEALVDDLMDQRGVRRITAITDPDNLASVRVLERLGFEYEGRTVESYFQGPGSDADTADELLFGLTIVQRDAWRDRPIDRPDEVRLIEITAANQRAVADLATHYSQRRFVAPVPRSYGDALFPAVVGGTPVEPWLRAVEADGEPTGFVMVALGTVHPGPYLWRFLIDRWHQGRGIGARALELVEATMRDRGHSDLGLSFVEGPGSPGPFYLARGYEPTEERVDGEIVARKRLDSG